MSTYQDNIRPINELYPFVSEWISEHRFHKVFQNISDVFDAEWNSDIHNNHWKDSKVRKILQVFERIKLTDNLYANIHHEFISRYHYPRLIIYLRLTCFDQLGQPDSWREFGNWLAKKNNQERDSIINLIDTKNQLDFTKQLHKEYQLIYGVRNSFKNFISNVIPESARLNLLNQIKIEKFEKRTNYAIGKIASDSEKIDYLFSIRNDYTHGTFGTGSIFKNEKEVNCDEEWEFREILYLNEGKNNLSISTHNCLSETIKKTVFIGIAEVLKKIVF